MPTIFWLLKQILSCWITQQWKKVFAIGSIAFVIVVYRVLLVIYLSGSGINAPFEVEKKTSGKSWKLYLGLNVVTLNYNLRVANFRTNWPTGQTNRFQAAATASQRCCLSVDSISSCANFRALPWCRPPSLRGSIALCTWNLNKYGDAKWNLTYFDVTTIDQNFPTF